MNRNPLRKHKQGIWAEGRPGGGLKVPAAFEPLCSALTSASWQGLTYREEVKQTDIAGRNSPDTHGRRVSEEVGSAGVTFSTGDDLDPVRSHKQSGHRKHNYKTMYLRKKKKRKKKLKKKKTSDLKRHIWNVLLNALGQCTSLSKCHHLQ